MIFFVWLMGKLDVFFYFCLFDVQLWYFGFCYVEKMWIFFLVFHDLWVTQWYCCLVGWEVIMRNSTQWPKNVLPNWFCACVVWLLINCGQGWFFFSLYCWEGKLKFSCCVSFWLSYYVFSYWMKWNIVNM